MSTFESVLASISEVSPWCIVIICVRFNIIWCKVMRRVIDPKSGHFLAPILRVPATKLSNFWRKKKPVMLFSISLDKFKILISLKGVKKIMQIFTFFYSNYTNFLIKYGFLHNFVAKNLFDKVSKIKNLRWQFCGIFRWLRHGLLCFFCRRYFHGEICKIKWPLSELISAVI